MLNHTKRERNLHCRARVLNRFVSILVNNKRFLDFTCHSICCSCRWLCCWYWYIGIGMITFRFSKSAWSLLVASPPTPLDFYCSRLEVEALEEAGEETSRENWSCRPLWIRPSWLSLILDWFRRLVRWWRVVIPRESSTPNISSKSHQERQILIFNIMKLVKTKFITLPH